MPPKIIKPICGGGGGKNNLPQKQPLVQPKLDEDQDRCRSPSRSYPSKRKADDTGEFQSLAVAAGAGATKTPRISLPPEDQEDEGSVVEMTNATATTIERQMLTALSNMVSSYGKFLDAAGTPSAEGGAFTVRPAKMDDVKTMVEQCVREAARVTPDRMLRLSAAVAAVLAVVHVDVQPVLRFGQR